MKFVKEIIRPGKYHTRSATGDVVEHDITPDRISHWNETFAKMRSNNLQIPAPFRHDKQAEPLRFAGDKQDIDAFNNGGFWETTWVDPSTSRMYGLLDVPNSDKAKKIQEGEIKHVSLLAKDKWLDPETGTDYDDAFTHIALVTHPVSKEQEPFETVGVAMSIADSDETDTAFNQVSEEITATPSSASPSASNVKSVTDLLGKLPTPITLPNDTNEANFMERLAVAIMAVISATKSSEPDSVTEEPEGADEKPAPIAMSKELETALGILNKQKVVNPETKKPFTLDDLQEKEPTPPVQFSAEQQAALNFAKKSTRQQYVDRITACVKRGKVSPTTAKSLAEPMLKDFEVAFSAEGEIVKGPLDYVIEAWEQIPDGSVLTGASPTSAKKKEDAGIFGNETAFSFADDVIEEEPILQFTETAGDHDVPDEIAAKLAEEQLARYQ
jgi:hypothetical protein